MDVGIGSIAARLEPACFLCDTPLRSRFGRGAFDVLTCSSCGLGRTVPPPAEADGEEYFADDDAHYERHYRENRDRWRRFGAALLDRIPPERRRGRLLDVGAGVGLLVELAAERGFVASGLDRAPAAGRVARRLGLDVRTQELEDAVDGEFDVVVLMHVLEHVFDPVGFVALAGRKLREGGLLVVNVPAADGVMPRLLGRRWYGFQPSQHVHQFGRRSLRGVVERAGLRVVSVSSESLHYEGQPYRAVAALGRLLGRGDQTTLLASR
jgi:SAM-dependent methyltransferase